MRIGLIIAGLLFFVNPNINIIDVFPDFIGCLLIYAGIYRLEPVSPSFGAALEPLRRLALVNAVKTASIPVIFIIGSDEKTFLLVFTLGFMLLETIYFISSFRYIADGLSYLGTRLGFSIPKPSGLAVSTLVFAVVRAFLNIMPELVYLTQVYDDAYVESYSLVYYKPVLILVGVFFSLVSGAVWLCLSVSFFRRIGKNTAFMESLQSEVAAIVIPEGEKVRKRFSYARFLIGAGAVFMIDFFTMGTNIMPDFVGAIFLTTAAFVLIPVCGMAKKSVFASSAYIAVSAAAFIASLGCGDISETGAPLYYLIFEAISSAAFILSLGFICRMISKISDAHTGVFAEDGFYHLNTSELRRKNMYRNKMIGCFIGGIAEETVSLLMYAMIDAKAWYWWVINFAVTGVWVLYTIWALGSVYEGICDKYPVKKAI
ncbi:MAG: hypothetical protein PUE85_02010 [Firmicutes bacterium]|nr:hypothetical protein [Bacillota bacterium]